MSAYMTFKSWDELLDYLSTTDHPKCFKSNYLPDTEEYALWIGNQPYEDYEKMIELEYKEKQFSYGKLLHIDNIIKQGRYEARTFK